MTKHEMYDSQGDLIEVEMIYGELIEVCFKDLDDGHFALMNFNKEKLNEFIKLLKKASESL